jgi:hypothetical protein
MFFIVELIEFWWTEFLIRSFSGKFFALKLKIPKIPFGIAPLKHYRTVNTNSKGFFNSSFYRKLKAK